MIGVVEGPRTSFLDHLIPLCHLLQIPLYCEDAYVRAAAEIYYPPVELVETLEATRIKIETATGLNATQMKMSCLSTATFF
jgi:hypothetical protein